MHARPMPCIRDRTRCSRRSGNLGFLRRCIEGFRYVNFGIQSSGRIYLRIEGGVPVMLDPSALQAAFRDPDTRQRRASGRGSLAGRRYCSSRSTAVFGAGR